MIVYRSPEQVVQFLGAYQTVQLFVSPAASGMGVMIPVKVVTVRVASSTQYDVLEDKVHRYV